MSADKAKPLSDRDMKILAMAFLCFDNQPKVDYNKLKELTGLGTPASATTAFSNVKKRLFALHGGSNPAASNGGGKGGSPKKRGATADVAEKGASNKRSRKKNVDDGLGEHQVGTQDDEEEDTKTRVKEECGFEDFDVGTVDGDVRDLASEEKK